MGPALDRAVAHMDTTGGTYAFVMQKGSVAPSEALATPFVTRRLLAHVSPVVESRHAATGSLPSRADALRRVIAHTPSGSTAVLASTGFCGRELFAIEDRSNHLYMVGSMGCVVPLALGLALARPDLRVVALDGDGAALMRLGAFATVGAYRPANLQHLLLDNGVHDSTGGQATVSPQVSVRRHGRRVRLRGGAGDRRCGEHRFQWLDAPPVDRARFCAPDDTSRELEQSSRVP